MPENFERAAILADAMGESLPMSRYEELLPAFGEALADAHCETIERIASLCAQVGHESGGLRWMEEIADGSGYEWRSDLGNVNPGDGCRYKGRGPIQVTGRYNYTRLSAWAFDQGLVSTPTFFVDDPASLASDIYGFTGVVWYWIEARDMNAHAYDVDAATWAVNGGMNGINDRRQRYEHCMSIGERLLRLPSSSQVVGEADVTAPIPEAVEKVLGYSVEGVPQETGYWCGPASAQICLDTRGVALSEEQLAREIGTHTGGTDYIGLITPVLNSYLPGADYGFTDITDDPPNQSQMDRMWNEIVRSIDAGYGTIMNWVAPPNNYPRAVKGSQSPSYGGGTVYHYVTCMGYDTGYPGRALWIADPGFRPFEYWVSFDQAATLVPPKGYAFARGEPRPEPTLR